MRAAARNFDHRFRKCLRIKVIDRFSVLRSGKTCIRVDDDRNGGGLHHFGGDREQLARTQRTVEPQGIDAESLKHGDDAADRAPGQHPCGAVKYNRDENRQGAVLFCREYGGFCFQCITHGLDHDEISAFIRSAADNLCKYVHCLFKMKIAHGLEQASGRAYIECDISVCPACCAHAFPHMAYPGADDVSQFFRVTVVETVGPERVGVHDIAAGGKIAPVQLDDPVRMDQVPALGQLTAL